MTANLKLKGIIVPIVSPFDKHGKLDVEALEDLIEFLIEAGVHGIFPAGTTGEGPLLRQAERYLLAEKTIEKVANRVPVIIHSGAVSTKETLELSNHAKTIGAQAVAIIPPFYFSYGEQALYEFYAKLATELEDFPIFLYNNPGVGNANKLSYQLSNKLLQKYSNIIGMKDSSGSLDLLLQLSEEFKNFSAAVGGDGLILMASTMGIDAFISGNANVFPELFVSLYNAASQGEIEIARELQKKVNQVRRILKDGGDLSLFKGIMAKRGINVGQVRSPLLAASNSQLDQCQQELATIGLL